MTRRAERFIEANEISPVVYGSVLIDEKRRRVDGYPVTRGCYYRLADGQTFELTVEECRIVGLPRWAHDEMVAA